MCLIDQRCLGLAGMAAFQFVGSVGTFGFPTLGTVAGWQVLHNPLCLGGAPQTRGGHAASKY